MVTIGDIVDGELTARIRRRRQRRTDDVDCRTAKWPFDEQAVENGSFNAPDERG